MKRFARALTGATAMLAAACLSLALVGCDKKDDAGPTTSTPSTGLTVGFIYVGTKDDYGYNQAHHEGAEAVKKMPGVKVVEQEKVLETDAVTQAMESMINNEEAKLIF